MAEMQAVAQDLTVKFTTFTSDGAVSETESLPLFPPDMPESERERILAEIGKEWERMASLTRDAGENTNG